MIKIAITDDQKVEVDLLSKYVSEWADNKKVLIEINTYNSAEAFVFDWEEDKSYDILLLDIQMLELDGISLAKKIRETDQELKIIFITAISDFIQEGYDVDALNYLLKPVSKDKLFQCLDKANKKISMRQDTILINTGEEIKRILLSEIVYIEADSHFLHINLLSEKISTRMNLCEVEAQLPVEEFIKSHRSFIVNIAHVNSIQRDTLVMDNKSVVPVSRRQYNVINQAFINYNMKR